MSGRPVLAATVLVSLVLFAIGMVRALDSIAVGSPVGGCVTMLIGFAGVVGASLAWASTGHPHRPR